MGKCISSQKLTSTLSLAKCRDGFWLYYTTIGMNISMRVNTEQVDIFVSQFIEEEGDCEFRS